MTIKEIQDGIIRDLKGLYADGTLFTYDINKCTTLFELVVILGQYGYTRERALGVLNNVIITNELVPSLSDEELPFNIDNYWDSI
jgi:hypothetical protein